VAGCGGGGSSSGWGSSSSGSASLVGTWTLSAVNVDGNPVPVQDYLRDGYGGNPGALEQRVTFTTDQTTRQMLVDGEVAEAAIALYTVTGTTITLTDEVGDDAYTTSYTLSGDTLVLTADGEYQGEAVIVVLTFTRVRPTLISFSPTSGAIGTTVTLTGTLLSGATSVKFNGISATSFTINSDTSITASVPVGATTGKISLTIPDGEVATGDNFTVLAVTLSSIRITTMPEPQLADSTYPAALTDNYQFHATAVYSDGSEIDITNSGEWSVSKPTFVKNGTVVNGLLRIAHLVYANSWNGNDSQQFEISCRYHGITGYRQIYLRRYKASPDPYWVGDKIYLFFGTSQMTILWINNNLLAMY
ncbi:MAG TPA: lipocalin family protein, partial [Armatimonadota bacterium]|nr:lipocalin family protein [Armatimonadota bacterium]